MLKMILATFLYLLTFLYLPYQHHLINNALFIRNRMLIDYLEWLGYQSLP